MTKKCQKMPIFLVVMIVTLYAVNKVTNEIFNGMPQFDSADEWIENNYEILEWCCPNNGLHCNKGYYPKEKYPQYYNTCYLYKK
jgi:hypothetical protein